MSVNAYNVRTLILKYIEDKETISHNDIKFSAQVEKCIEKARQGASRETLVLLSYTIKGVYERLVDSDSKVKFLGFLTTHLFGGSDIPGIS